MTEKTIRDAINEALRQEMSRDPSVVVFGEDVRVNQLEVDRDGTKRPASKIPSAIS